MLCEKFLIEGRLKHTTESRRALVGFSGVVAYLMADETNLPFEAYDERDEGYLHNYSKSRFLDFINRTSGDALFDSIPTPSKHYGLTTSDHIVFVLATKEPQLEIVR